MALEFTGQDGGDHEPTDRLGSLVVFFIGDAGRLPSLCTIHRDGMGGRNGVRRRAVSLLLLWFGVVCMTANVGLENSIRDT